MYPRIIRFKEQTARKPHDCHGCYRGIRPGDLYLNYQVHRSCRHQDDVTYKFCPICKKKMMAIRSFRVQAGAFNLNPRGSFRWAMRMMWTHYCKFEGMLFTLNDDGELVRWVPKPCMPPEYSGWEPVQADAHLVFKDAWELGDKKS